MDTLSHPIETIDVFTPTKPAVSTYVEREEINCQLVDALRTPGKQLIVYGFTGSGKTTLLKNKLDQLYENYISTSCTKGMKLDQIRRDAFDQMDKYYLAKRNKSSSTSIGLAYKAIKAELSTNETGEYERIIPIQLSDQRLAEFIGEAKCCWIIEDFHKVEKSEKEGLAQMMKVFMDMASKYANAKIIAIGAVGTAREVIDYDREMRNRVSEVHVKLMTIDELENIIKKGSKLLNIHFPREIIDEITYYSNGLASLCHQMCLSMCFNREIFSTSESYIEFNRKDFEKAVNDYVNQNSDTLKSTFDKAKRLDKGKDITTMEIFKTIIKKKSDEITFDDLIRTLRKRKPTLNTKSFRSMITKLSTPDYGEILRYNSDGKFYFFSNPFHKLYVQFLMDNDSTKIEDQFHKISIRDIHAFLRAKHDMEDIIPFDDLDVSDIDT
jgi:hypothetical protein